VFSKNQRRPAGAALFEGLGGFWGSRAEVFLAHASRLNPARRPKFDKGKWVV
jgi:hypothetical protein